MGFIELETAKQAETILSLSTCTVLLLAVVILLLHLVSRPVHRLFERVSRKQRCSFCGAPLGAPAQEIILESQALLGFKCERCARETYLVKTDLG